MYIKRRRQILTVIMVIIDVCLITASFLSAHWLRSNISVFGRKGGQSLAEHRDLIGVAILAWPIILALMNLYEPRRRWNISELFFTTLTASFFGVVFILAYSYSVHALLFSRLMFFYLWLISGISIFCFRFFVKRTLVWLAGKGIGVKKVVVAGLGKGAFMLAREYKEHPEMGWVVTGFVTNGDIPLDDLTVAKFEHLSSKGILCSMDEICEIVKREVAKFVVLTGSLSDRKKFLNIVEELSGMGVDIHSVPDLFEIAPRHMRLCEVGRVPVISFSPHSVSGWEAVAKRIIDIVVSAWGLILLSPLLGIVAILIKRETPGQVFFAQERIGQNGRPFKMYKFRSMVAEAANAPPVKVKKNDERVTKIGRFIRSTSIDELPQLFNVLTGDMSLVGPRPETRLYVDQYNEWHRQRLYLRPGITGLAQAAGVRGNTSITEKTKYDLEYAETQSLLLDLKILFKTVLTVFFHREAY